MKSSLWSPLVHQVYRDIRKWDQENPQKKISNSRVLVAFSGGVDSTVLLSVLLDLKEALCLELVLFHAHHGPASEEQLKFRDQAQTLAKERAKALGLLFFSAVSKIELKSEQQMRDFRQTEIRQVQVEAQAQWVAWGHHRDDYLETQVLRLIRGTGIQGLTPMSWAKETSFRPLLSFSKAELVNEAETQKLKWCDDPSNQALDYLRNWLRQVWLPMLEDKSPGALQSLARSLGNFADLLQESHENRWPQELWAEEHLSRPVFLTLKATERRQCLAMYLRKLGSQNYTQNHINEIMKHLDNSKSEHRFECAQMAWSLSRDRIEARPV